MRGIAIYVEGGGDSAQTRGPFRRGFHTFLRQVVEEARKLRIRCQIIPCGGRQHTYEAFVDAMKKEPEIYNALLVDAEEPVSIAVSPWVHLQKVDRWSKPKQSTDKQCHLMVACMETWFLADPDGLRAHFGSKFNASALPSAKDMESCTKEIVNQSLQKAVRQTPAKQYMKIRAGVKLLERIDSSTVRSRCKWCNRLFVELIEAIGIRQSNSAQVRPE